MCAQVVAGARHDYGRRGRLLVCDGTGFYEVLNRREVHRLELPKSGAAAALQLLHRLSKFSATAVASVLVRLWFQRCGWVLSLETSVQSAPKAPKTLCTTLAFDNRVHLFLGSGMGWGGGLPLLPGQRALRAVGQHAGARQEAVRVGPLVRRRPRHRRVPAPGTCIKLSHSHP